MTPRVPLRLWWKAQRDWGHLRPIRKLVHRLGHHGEIQVFYQTFWEAEEPQQGAPHQPTSEDLNKILDRTRVLQWYDALDKEFENEVGASGWRDPAWKLSRREWEQLVNEAHKDLKETYGSDRVVALIGGSAHAASVILSQGILGLPYFGMLWRQTLSEVNRTILDVLGLPYVYWHAVNGGTNAGQSSFYGTLEEILANNPEISNPLFPHTPFSVGEALVPHSVIDPNSKQEIQIDSYLKRWLPLLEEKIGAFLLRNLPDAMEKIINPWIPVSPSHWTPTSVTDEDAVRKQEIINCFRWFYETDKSSPALKPDSEAIDEVLKWIEQNPEALKTLLSFFVHTGDRDVALLGFHSVVKTMREVAKLCRSRGFPPSTATETLKRIQEIFEQQLEESKKTLEMEKFPIPPRRVWETFWTTLGNIFDMKRAEGVHTDALGLKDLLNWDNWNSDKWDGNKSEMFKAVVRVLFGEGAAQKSGDYLLKSSNYLKDTINGLFWFAYCLQNLGRLSIRDHKQQLEERARILSSERGISENELHTQLAQKAIRKFHNNISSIAKNVQKLKDSGVFLAKPDYATATDFVAVIDFSPKGFYSLTKDETCFGKDRKHHPFILSGIQNSFVIRFFAYEWGNVGRMWGVVNPNEKAIYFTNHYGSISINVCKQLARDVAAVLFGVRPDELTIENEKDTRKIRSMLRNAMLLKQRRTTPYLNGDAFKISAKG